MIIKTLVEDTTSKNNLRSEHGLSLYIETSGKKILFDSGTSGLFMENAIKMGIDISKIDYAIISHGHNDHGGGLERFFIFHIRYNSSLATRIYIFVVLILVYQTTTT